MTHRHHSLDLLRGLVMLFMIIDHTQEYQAGPGKGLITDPMNLALTHGPVFWSRILSHFCAPIFIFLMGISAFLSGQRRPPSQASRHLLIRGLVLIALELTLCNWAWTFNPLWPRYFFQVIGAMGVAMLVLAAAPHLPRPLTALAGLSLVTLHNLTDSLRFPPDTALHYLWSFLHQKNVLPLAGGFEIRTTYPVLPVIGLALCGYAAGRWFTQTNPPLLRAGLLITALFLALRLPNLYGDPNPFVPADGLRSLMNVTKYPLSLQFIAMTLGPALLFLHWARHRRQPVLEQLGRTAMVFYLAHLFLLHAAALAVALLTGQTIDCVHRFGGIPDNIGFPPWATAPLALAAATLLYPLCRWYEPRRLPYL